jgi:hypothetical protein
MLSREYDVSLYASDVNWSRCGGLVNGHCVEMGRGSDGEVGGCTHFIVQRRTRIERVNAIDRMMTNLKRVTV